MTVKRFFSSFLLLVLVWAVAACQQTAAPPTPPSVEATQPPAVATEELVEPTNEPAAEPTAAAEESTPLYLDPTAPIEQRVEDLLGRMTLEEKIGQMTLVEKGSMQNEDITTLGIGGLLSGGGGYPASGNTAAGWLEMVNEYQSYALESRLGIPLIYGVDAVHGHNNLKGATIFPHNIGLGATADANLVERIGRATALETAATGIRWNYAPVLAVVRDIRWGRTYEAFGENTELVTTLGTAYLQGLQGTDLTAPTSVIGTPKHFIGDGGTSWGSSHNSSYQIDQGNTEIDEAGLRTLYLPPYQAAVDAGAQTVMVSFSRWNDEFMHGQSYLLTDVLKKELGFNGFLVSDWQAIDQINPDYYQAVVQSINAGVDFNMVPYDYGRFISTMTKAVEQGDITEERIDDAVRRILTVKFVMGLFENPLGDDSLLEHVGSAEHRALAREAVQKSLVLLKNENSALPISPEVQTIFVAGEAADDLGIQCGGWTIEWQGKPGNLTEGTTILEGLETAVSAETRVQFNRFAKFDNITDDSGQPLIADVGIVVLHERPYAEGQGDSATLALDDNQLELVAKMKERSQKVVVVLITGRPMIITDILDQADAVVAAWLPGTEGNGVTDVLFGQAPFTGKLPFTWPRTADQLPFDFATLTEEDVLFPYGFGITN